MRTWLRDVALGIATMLERVASRYYVALVALAGACAAAAQAPLGVALDGVDGAAVFNALAQECYEAGMWSDMPSDSIMDCADPVPDRPAADDSQPAVPATVVRHKVRFTLIERGGGGRIGAEAWTETEELGTIIEEPVTSQDYLSRVQGVLETAVVRVRERDAQPWAPRFASEQAWHLEAHLRAVSRCDANLGSLTAAALAEQLESVGLRALGDDTRDRCEQLYTHLYEWSLARGDAEPTVQEYLRYRAALPPEQRICSGQLAWDATCRR